MLENEVPCKKPHLQPLNFTTPGNAASSTEILQGHTQAKFKLKCKDSIFSFSVKSMRLHAKVIAMAIVGRFRHGISTFLLQVAIPRACGVSVLFVIACDRGHYFNTILDNISSFEPTCTLGNANFR